MRYARYAIPEFIVNNAMTEEAMAFYLHGLYRLDPLLRTSRAGPYTGVFSLSRLRTSDRENAYFDGIFRSAVIYDELAMLFAAPGRVCIAVCLDRSSRVFNDQEIERFEMLFPALEGLHDSHLDKLITPGYGTGKSIWDDTEHGVMVLDREHREVFSNGVWQEFNAQYPDATAGKIHRNRDSGIISLDRDMVLHWETLGESFAVAPGGKICIIERRSAGYGANNFEKTIGQFAESHSLTPREKTIVSLTLTGNPNLYIANTLGISPGTVRNHKYRLYNKLDITTERELFRMVIGMLVGEQA